MAKEKKEKHFIRQPVYEGGPAALRKFIGENMRYPKEAADNNVEGTVVIRYTINHKGVVTSGKVISGIGHGCNEEAKRLVKLLKFQVSKQRGMKIKYHKDLKIHFRKPKVAKAKKVERQITYTVTSGKKGADKSTETPTKKPGAGGSYNYTVDI